jgi:hypothetical protein
MMVRDDILFHAGLALAADEAALHPTPRNAAKAWLTFANVASFSRPIRFPAFARGTVVALSTITCDRRRSPVPSPGSTVTRSSGMSWISLVSGSTVRDGCST